MGAIFFCELRQEGIPATPKFYNKLKQANNIVLVSLLGGLHPTKYILTKTSVCQLVQKNTREIVFPYGPCFGRWLRASLARAIIFILKFTPWVNSTLHSRHNATNWWRNFWKKLPTCVPWWPTSPAANGIEKMKIKREKAEYIETYHILLS